MPLSQSSLRLPNRQRRTRNLVSLTPLIDVVFILLIFLMLVSNFLDRSAFEISMGTAGDAPALKSDTPPLQLRLMHGGHAELDGLPLLVAEIGRTLLVRATGRESARVLLVRSDAGVDLQTVITAMSAARHVPGLKVYMVRNGAGK